MCRLLHDGTCIACLHFRECKGPDKVVGAAGTDQMVENKAEPGHAFKEARSQTGVSFADMLYFDGERS